MGFVWTDDPANTSIHIRTIHVNELRGAVDTLRSDVSLPAYTWTDNPVSTTTHMRAIHFTELRSALNDVWTAKGMGPMPNWSLGSAPNTGRQISARDMNDLRHWVNTVDPPYALNGLHWQNPPALTSDAEAQMRAGGVGFGSTLILFIGDSSQPTWNPSTDPTCQAITWLASPGNLNCDVRSKGVAFNEIVIVRLWYFQASQQQLPTDPEVLAARWGPFIRWCQTQGVSNFQVLNELNMEYDGSLGASPALWHPVNPGYMQQLATDLRAQGTPGQNLWLQFPGPGGNVNQAVLPPSDWDTYWSGYADTINNYYDGLALHVYPANASPTPGQALIRATHANLEDVTSRFSTKYQRITEYGISIQNYGGDTPSNHAARGNDYAAFVNDLRSGWTQLVRACHVFIGQDSPDYGAGTAEHYELYTGSGVDEAANITTGVGCVGL